MKASIHIALIVLSLTLPSCRSHRTPPLDDIWGIMKDKPDSALAVLEQYSLQDFKSRKRKAEYALLKSVALDKNFIDITSDSLIRLALDFYGEKGNYRKRMLSWYYAGRIYANAEDYNRAIVSITRAEEFSEHQGDPYYKALICMAKENIYSHTHNYSEALQAAEEGVRIFEGEGEFRQALLAKRRLAMDYISVRDFETADSLLLDIIRDSHVDSVLAGRCILGHAWSLALQGRYPESLKQYDIGITTYRLSLTLPLLEEYGVALYHTGKEAEADALRDRLKGVPSARKSYLMLHLESCLRSERFEEALTLQREMIQMEDSIAVQTLEQSLIKSLRDYQRENRESFRIKAENRKLAIICIILFSAITLIALLFILARLRLRHRLKEVKMMEVQEEIRSLLKDANEKNLVLEGQLMQARKQYISVYKKRFSRIAHLSETYFRSSGSTDSREVVYREVRDLASFLTTDNQTYKKLEKEVNNNLSGAMEWFRKEFVGAKEQDYRFVCYLMAGFPASTIGLLTGLSSSNVYVRKNRLIETIQSRPVEHKDLFLLVLK